jgi:hypothetical protein
VSNRRGTVSNPENDPYGAIGGAVSGGRVSFGSSKPGLLAGVADSVTDRGHALVLSRTSDGGALSIGVLHDALVTKFYAKAQDELDGLLAELAQVK